MYATGRIVPRGSACITRRWAVCLRDDADQNCISHGGKVYFKVTPPSERSQLEHFLFSKVPESELGTNAPKDLGRPLADFRAVSPFSRKKLLCQTRRFLFQ